MSFRTGRDTARLPYAQPDRVIQYGEPAFKTQKQLAGRAVVSEAWCKNPAEPLKPGEGRFGYRDGYNVLYGDSSVSWFGDPQQRIQFWPLMQNGDFLTWPPVPIPMDHLLGATAASSGISSGFLSDVEWVEGQSVDPAEL